jgi:hypothetical protein
MPLVRTLFAVRSFPAETRIHATDPASPRRFARYWRMIRPGSGLIRRSWLHAAKGRAELAGSDTTRV